MITPIPHWYDGQMRRFLEQIVRAFSGFQYVTGWKDGQAPQTLVVPCRLALTDRMISNIIKNGSENTINAVPMIVVYQTGLQGRRTDIQSPNHIDTRQVSERAVDPVTNKYTGDKGSSYSVSRLMPRPFEMAINVDIWTSSLDQKHQLIEQIGTIFFPDITIQSSENPLDWTAMTTLEWADCNFSSRSIPVGTSDEIDVATISFRLPMWLSPPAKVMQQKLIEQIVTNIHDARITDVDPLSTDNIMTRNITTPGNHSISVNNGKVTLLGEDAGLYTPEGEIFDWLTLIKRYGVLRPTQSQIHLLTSTNLDDRSHDIIGTIQYDSTNSNEMFFQIDPDTLPSNTLDPITGVIDPQKTFPGSGLPAAVTGQRYLLLKAVTSSSVAWGALSANENSIIEYNGTVWTVVFNGLQVNPTTQYVLNTNSGRQLRFQQEGGQWEWTLVIDGTYNPGMWRIVL